MAHLKCRPYLSALPASRMPFRHQDTVIQKETIMQIPPPLPAAALTAGKIAVGLSWIFAIVALTLPMPEPRLATVGIVLLVFLSVSHLVELIVFREFLKAANATQNDYIQAFIFGMFHTGGLKIS